MKKSILLFGLIVLNLFVFSQSTLYWQFTNPLLVSGSPDKLTFDIEIKSSESTDMVSGGLVFNFNQSVFGVAPTVIITKGDDFSSFSASPITVNPGTVSYEQSNFTGSTTVSATYLKFCSVSMDLDNICGNPGITFNSGSMDGTSFYDLNNWFGYVNSYENDLLSFSFGTSASTSWVGGVSSDWNDHTNWTDCVPGATSNVIIGIGTYPAIASSNVTVEDLTIQPGAALTVNPSFSLTVSGSLLIESDTTGTGSLIQDGVLTGTIQRQIKGWGSYSALLKNGHGWHLLSSPVASQLNASFQNLLDNDDFLKWNEVGNAWENRRMPDNTLNSSFETTFGIGKGYLVAYEDNKTNLFQGILNVADVSVNGLTNSWTAGPVNYYGHHLLGNPFASALEWGTGDWSRTNVENHVQIWNEVNASYSVIGVGDPIPAMQGFFVYTPGSGSLTIPASARIHSTQGFYKSTNDQILLVARDLDHQMLQESKVSFNSDATELYDLEYDSYYMAGYAPTFYSVSNGEAFALNTLPEVSDDLTIPFVFVKNDGTNFSITLEENIEDATIYLVDLKANQTINLSEVNQYSFVSVAGDNPDRFLLKFSPVGINDVINNTSVNIFAYGNTLYLNSSEYLGNTTVSVFDMLGREILQEQITLDGQSAINISGYSGAYIVRAVTDREVVSKKVYFR